MERFDTVVREIVVQAALSENLHCRGGPPVFIRVYGVFETINTLVIEMELSDGRDLFQGLSSNAFGYGGTVPEMQASKFVYSALLAISYMQSLSIAHRDIKLANLLTCSIPGVGMILKLGDFGMSNFAGEDGFLRGRCGTPGYVAPEILEAGPTMGYPNHVDVFSLGVVAYILLCGYEPFYGVSDRELVAANKAARFTFPEQDWEEITEEAKVRETKRVN